MEELFPDRAEEEWPVPYNPNSGGGWGSEGVKKDAGLPSHQTKAGSRIPPAAPGFKKPRHLTSHPPSVAPKTKHRVAFSPIKPIGWRPDPNPSPRPLRWPTNLLVEDRVVKGRCARGDRGLGK